MKPQEREQKAIESMNRCSKLRNELITEARTLADIVQWKDEAILMAVFNRKYSPNHMSQWWKDRSPRFMETWLHKEAYDSAASKLTAEERKLLGI